MRLASRKAVASCLVVGCLLASAITSNGRELFRKLQDESTEGTQVQLQGSTAADSNTSSSSTIVEEPRIVKVVPYWRPFMALKDPAVASGGQINQLYEQAGAVASIAYLLFGAAQPLSKAPGSSNALLSYLTPTVLQLYSSQPERCSSPLVANVYSLARDLYGSPQLQACHYALYQALGDVFGWVRDHLPMALQEIPYQPLAIAAWPDLVLVPSGDMAAAVAGALGAADQLAATAASMEGACGIAPSDLAALVPRISDVLSGLHSDLPMLQQLGTELHDKHWHDDIDTDTISLVVKGGAEEAAALGAEAAQEGAAEGSVSAEIAARRRELSELKGRLRREAAGAAAARRLAVEGQGLQQRRRKLAAIPPNFNYTYPTGFTASGPASKPALLVPLVFHVLLYRDTDGSVAPANYTLAPTYIQRLVRVANYMSKPGNIQFFITEIRNDPAAYPSLVLPNRSAWLTCPKGGTNACLANSTFVQSAVVDFPRSVNVFIVSDSTGGAGVPLGYAFVPGSDTNPSAGHVFMTWDSASTSGYNRLPAYNDGPNTLLHELYHHLGVYHPFGNGTSCAADDEVIDTPATLNAVSSTSFASTAIAYCMNLFWGKQAGDWDAAYARWSTTTGIPVEDMNAWADSCPGLPGYDELGNYMTYNSAVCFAAVGHFTPGQYQRAHFLTSELNPVLYTWGQYYAATASTPPPTASPPPEFYNNICRATRTNNCACKSSWTFGVTSYSYCDKPDSNGALSCEVVDPSTCAGCPTSGQCVLSCAGNSQQCDRPAVAAASPPPRPPSPPPLPPPPPPLNVPDACKKSASGCDCRRTWLFGSVYSGYCGLPDGDPYAMWCEVTPACPKYDPANPYEYCSTRLNTTFCNGWRLNFNTVVYQPPSPPLPPSPPSPPPSPPLPPSPPPSPPLPPSPPPSPPPLPRTPSPPPSSPPPAVVVARARGSVRIDANCSAVLGNAASTAGLIVDLISELARVAAVPSSQVAVTNLSCGSVVAAYVISFTQGATPEQVSNASSAVQRLTVAVSTAFAAKWGAVEESSSSVEVLQKGTLCASGSSSALCASPPPPPSPPASKQKKFPLLIIIAAAAGGGAIILIIIVVLIVIAVRRPQSQVHPQPPRGAGPRGPPLPLPGNMVAPLPAAHFRPPGGYDAAYPSAPPAPLGYAAGPYAGPGQYQQYAQGAQYR